MAINYKVGDKVRYLGVKNNLWGDTANAEENDRLIVGNIYVVAKSNHIWQSARGPEVMSISLHLYSGGTWGLATECVAPLRPTRQLPAWF